MGQNKELREERDKALYESYVHALETHRFTGRTAAADFARSCHAPRFFMSPKTLSNHIGDIEAGKSVRNVGSNKRKMIRVLYDRYVKYLDEHPGCTMSRERICEFITDQPAPSFFIGLSSACHIIDRERRKAAMRWRIRCYGRG